MAPPRFQEGTAGDWKQYRALPDLMEVNFQKDERSPVVPYWEAMHQIKAEVIDALTAARSSGKKYVLFTHGWPTSGKGSITTRSIIRSVMLSPEATPLIVRANCIQHWSVFVAAIRSSDEVKAR